MKNNNFIIIVPAKLDIKKQVELMAKDMHKSEHISPLDACTCTGNCGQGSVSRY